MNGRRALTLIEVLAATVLLAVMTVACLPLVRQSLLALDAPEPAVEVRELAALADAFVRDAAANVEIDADGGAAPSVIDWPDDPDRPVVTVTRLLGPEPPVAAAPDENEPNGIEHDWLVFRCADATVCRWVAKARASDDDVEPASRQRSRPDDSREDLP